VRKVHVAGGFHSACSCEAVVFHTLLKGAGFPPFPGALLLPRHTERPGPVGFKPRDRLVASPFELAS
jgi:hypothetical protein